MLDSLDQQSLSAPRSRQVANVDSSKLPLIMVPRWAVNGIREAERFALYAHGYLDNAISFCEHMVSHEERRTWPNAAVVLLTAVHSVELFLMAAILARAPVADTQCHHLDLLARTYRNLYPEPAFAFDMPFRTTNLSAVETENQALNAPEPIPAIFFRRIRGTKKAVQWISILDFEAREFLEILIGLRTSFERIGRSTTPHLRR